MNIGSIVAAAGLCACLAYLGVLLASHLCDSIVPFEDGPTPATTSVPLLIGCAALLGGFIALRGVDTAQLGLLALLCLCLCAIWYTDVRCGIVPDVFTIGPLIALLGAAVYMHHWPMLISSLVVFTPFAAGALLSRGRGMGWGDAKLVALGAAVLGMEAALLSFGVACAAAVLIAFMRGRRAEPIAFAPYLIVAIAASAAISGIA
ncbi:MAG: prepilin peptidase [Candidatus Eremiobacteraeota bacterium]|nr:prepilin peptidase [Candidatus Eremiobacteraeota bacterium]